MNDYKDSEFKRLLLNPYGRNKDADIFRLFPILGKYDAFLADTAPMNRNHVIRYVIFTFDKNTPLHNIDDLIEKRMRGALLAGFTTGEKNKFSHDVENMIRSKNPTVNAMIIQYLIIQSSEDFMVLTAYEESLRLQMEKLIKGDVDSEKTKELIANVETLRTNIKSIKSSILVKNDDPFLDRDIYTFSEVKKLRISPEDYAVLFDPSEEVIEEVGILDLLKEASKVKVRSKTGPSFGTVHKKKKHAV